MAKKPTTTRNLDSDVARELEKALDLDLSGDGAAISTSRRRWKIWKRRYRRPRTNWRAKAAARAAGRRRNRPDRPAEPVEQPQSAATGRPKPARTAARRTAQTSARSRPVSRRPTTTARRTTGRCCTASTGARRARSTGSWRSCRSLWSAALRRLADRCSARESGRSASLDQLFARPELIGLAVAAIVPVILFWAFAAMIRRAQEMRIAAQSMTEVAFRLAEPENLAQDRVMMVGQAVRREVAAMGEGIERTLARAVELETLVHTEVNQIERSYSRERSAHPLAGRRARQRARGRGHPCRARARLDHRRARDAAATRSARPATSSATSILNASTKLSMTITNSGDTLIDRINESGDVDLRFGRTAASIRSPTGCRPPAKPSPACSTPASPS